MLVYLFLGGKLCTFSPCIEQVQKTVDSLKGSGNFIQIRTTEVLQRPMSIQTRTLMSIDFGGSVSQTPEGTESGEGEKGSWRTAPVKKDATKFRTLVAPPTVPGHTGYLTLATFVPAESF